MVRVSFSDLPQRAVGRPYIYLRAPFVYVTVVGWALWFRWVQVCYAIDRILSHVFAVVSRLATHFTLSPDKLRSWRNSVLRSVIVPATCIGLFLPILVIRFGHSLIVGLNEIRVYRFRRWQNVCMQLSQFYKQFLSMIFKIPYTKCTAAQLGLCRLGEGRSDARVLYLLVFLNISACNILLRV